MDICQVVTEQGWWESGHMSSSYRAGMVGEWTCQVVTEQGWWASGHMSSSYRAGMVGEWTYVKQL